MEAIREMVYSDSEKLSIKIPKKFRRRRLEVIVVPAVDQNPSSGSACHIKSTDSHSTNDEPESVISETGSIHERLDSLSWRMGDRVEYSRDDLHERR